MDKYQAFALESIKVQETIRLGKAKSVRWNHQTITIEQNENYNITKYAIGIYGYPLLKIEYFIDGKIHNAPIIDQSENYFILEIDFNNKITSIKFYFVENVADPIEINIKYIDADKTLYDQKIATERQKELTKKANVQIKSGKDLINVTFCPIDDSYSHSTIELFSKSKGENNYQLMAKYKVASDTFFHSIQGLAYGEYAIILIEYNKNDVEIYKSDYITTKVYNSGSYGIGCIRPQP